MDYSVIRCVAAGCGAAITGAAAAGQWTVTNLQPAGATHSSAAGVYAGKQVGVATVGGQLHASLWTGSAASWIDLHPPGMLRSMGTAIHGDQQVGLVYPTQFTWRASLWTGSPAWVQLGTTQSVANSGWNGQQGGSAFVGSERHAGLWSGSAASWVDLHPPGVTISVVNGMADGQQVGYANVSTAHACLWTGTAASWVDLHPAGALQSWAYGVSDGVQVGAIALSSGALLAGRWMGTAASWTSLHPTGATESHAYAVSGGVIAGYAVIGGASRAGVWTGTAASWVNLHAFLPAVFTSSLALGVWSDGSVTRVVGSGFNSAANRDEALLWERVNCYPDCNTDGQLTVADFGCFQTKFVAADPYADCNGDGQRTVADFGCFQTKFVAGCP